MARVTMARAAVSNRPSAHSPLDNVTTPYNPIRLLKGAPPGQVSTIYNLKHSNLIVTKTKCRKPLSDFAKKAFTEVNFNLFKYG
jgi:hypothetical protein